MTDEDIHTHTCPYCGQTVRDNDEAQRPRYRDGSGYDPHYMKCRHCGYWHHIDNDCCPHCMAPYCGGW